MELMRRRMGMPWMIIFALLLGLFFVPAARAYTIEPVSMTPDGRFIGDHGSNGIPTSFSTSISHDGNVMTFITASNSICTTKNSYQNSYHRDNVFVRNITSKTTTWIDISKEYNDIFVWNVLFAEVSGNGKFIVISARVNDINYPYKHNLYIYDIEKNITKLIAENITPNSAVDINYDGRYSVFYGNKVTIYDTLLDSYKYINYQPVSNTYGVGARNIGIDDSGENIIFNVNNNEVIIYNTINDEFKNIVTKQASDKINGRSCCGGISANGKYALLLSESTYHPFLTNVYVYDVSNNTLTYANFTHHNEPMYAFTFYPGTYQAEISDDGRYVTAGMLRNANLTTLALIGLLDRQTGSTRYFPDTTNPHSPDTVGVAGGMTPDGRYLSVWFTSYTQQSPTFIAARFDMQDVQLFSTDAGLDQAIEQETPYGAYTTLTGLLSAGACSDEQTYRWSWSEGETIGTNPTIFLPPGITTVTLDWAGCGGTASDTVNVTVVDSTPPSLTVTGITGTAGNAGWYRSNVSVELAAADNGSGVAAIYAYTANGVETMVTGTSATVPVSGDGSHTLTSWAVDNDENRSTPPIVTTIQIDSIAPAITGAALAQPNANGWYNADMTVHFSATDTLSGIASVTPDTTLSTEGAGQSVTGTAFDVAGNRTDYSVNGINLDRTPPLITITGVASGEIYNLGLVPQATFTASDSLSGMAGNTGVITGTPDAFGCGTFTFTVTATDKAGNIATYSVSYEVKATPEGTSALIDALVNMGLLPSQTAETLQATLVKALSGYNSNPVLGDNMMNTFQNQINAALNSGKINATTAALLNNAANYIMVKN